MTCVARAVSLPRTATSSDFGASAGGLGRNTMNAPFGHTRDGTPFTVSVALPLPMEPKMKFESFDVTTELAVGYTTRMASGPSTSGTGGSGRAGLAAVVVPVAGVGEDSGGYVLELMHAMAAA